MFQVEAAVPRTARLQDERGRMWKVGEDTKHAVDTVVEEAELEPPGACHEPAWQCLALLRGRG